MTDPTKLLATQLYSPAWCAVTESMVSRDVFFPVFWIVMSGCVRAVIGSPFKLHWISIGESPLTILQIAETCSPQLAGSSPIEKGAICGATKKDRQRWSISHRARFYTSLDNKGEVWQKEGRRRWFWRNERKIEVDCFKRWNRKYTAIVRIVLHSWKVLSVQTLVEKKALSLWYVSSNN